MTPARIERWYDRGASVGSLIVAVVVMFSGFVASVVSMAVTNEQRHGQTEKTVALLAQRVEDIQRRNEEQDQRMNRREAENRAAFDTIMRALDNIRQSLAVHEARGGLGLQTRPYPPTVIR